MGLIFPVLTKLKIDLKRKLTLCALFGLGFFSVLSNIARTVMILRPPFTDGYYWATAEITVAIICASVPTIRPLFDKKAWLSKSAAGQSDLSAQSISATKSSKSRVRTMDSDHLSLPSSRWGTKDGSEGSIESYRKEIIGDV